MTKKVCGSCRWRVYDTDKGYPHEHNSDKDCFCLVQDFFTKVDKDGEICDEYIFDDEKDEG